MDTTFKPYLIRAVYEWCADQGFSPYLAVAVDSTCKVPMAHVRNGQIVLDISMDATHQLQLGAEAITFQARFGGVAQHLFVPMNRVLGLFPEHDQSLGAFFEVPQTAEQKVEQAAEQNAEQQSQAVQHDQNNASQAPSLGKPRITRVK
jgi:stringent starvation protein B